MAFAHLLIIDVCYANTEVTYDIISLFSKSWLWLLLLGQTPFVFFKTCGNSNIY